MLSIIQDERHGCGGVLILLECLIYVSLFASHMCTCVRVRVRSNLKFNNLIFYWNRYHERLPA